MVATLVTQSRIAAETASLSVRAPACDRLDARAQQLHALDVGLLAAHVLGAHVDDALQAQQRARGGGGDPVLAGAGLGDDPRLAHPLGEQRLAERVVDLVGAGVVEVLALEVDRVAGRLAEPPGVVQRRGPADVVVQQRVELARNAGSSRAASHAASSSASAGISVSGTYWPP